jgi:TPR repeat protein
MKVVLKSFLAITFLVASTVAQATMQDPFVAHSSVQFNIELEQIKQLAANGDVEQQFNLGLIYQRGQVVAQDYKAAAMWYRIASEYGHGEAQYNLGMMYYFGQGVMQDFNEAVNLLRLAAGNGFSPAQYNIGVMYTNGEGVVQDYHQAMSWFLKAAAQGLPDAQNSLGVMYFSGKGIPVDLLQAHMWFSLAAMSDYENAKSTKANIEVNMDQVQIEEAQMLARDWIANHPNLSK